MKKINLPPVTRSLLLIALIFGVLFLLNSCARKATFMTSSVVPAAEGTVKVKKDNNSNYDIHVSLTNLAEPNRLSPAKNLYVVWMDTDHNGTKNIGQINSSTGFLSGKLKASFETVSSFKPIKVFITAEDDASVAYPGTHLILTTANF
jgi:hypothetical protein